MTSDTNTLITKTMSFSQVLQAKPRAAEVFFKHQMGCVGCMAATFETIEQGANAHGVDADELIRELNAI